MGRKNNTYSNELKLEIVQTYLAGEESMQKIADKYKIRNVSQVKAWVKKFQEVESIEAFNRLPSTGSGGEGCEESVKRDRYDWQPFS
ncbi:transposase [Bacillus aerius]|uniref:transposase n=1 Tax=Bacillus aerius TaxID=293388 RepID=UPI002815DAB8|nr:transposase [Bacillus aerius]WMT28664.1 transposase [Bacillus aerius]